MMFSILWNKVKSLSFLLQCNIQNTSAQVKGTKYNKNIRVKSDCLELKPQIYLSLDYWDLNTASIWTSVCMFTQWAFLGSKLANLITYQLWYNYPSYTGCFRMYYFISCIQQFHEEDTTPSILRITQQSGWSVLLEVTLLAE